MADANPREKPVVRPALGRQTSAPSPAAISQDPACAYGFAAGYDDEGPPPISPHGPFFGVARWRKTSTTPTATHGSSSSARTGGTGLPPDLRRNLHLQRRLEARQLPERLHGSQTTRPTTAGWWDSDYQDVLAESDRRKGMAYFEYELNDYVTVRGEFRPPATSTTTRGSTRRASTTSTTGGGLADEPHGPSPWAPNPGKPVSAPLPTDRPSTTTGTARTASGIRPTTTPSCRPATPVKPVGRSSNWDDPAAAAAGLSATLNGNGRYDYLVEPGEFAGVRPGRQRRRHSGPRLGRRWPRRRRRAARSPSAGRADEPGRFRRRRPAGPLRPGRRG